MGKRGGGPAAAAAGGPSLPAGGKLGQVRLVQQFRAHDGVLWAVALHGAGRLVATGGQVCVGEGLLRDVGHLGNERRRTGDVTFVKAGGYYYWGVEGTWDQIGSQHHTALLDLSIPVDRMAWLECGVCFCPRRGAQRLRQGPS